MKHALGILLGAACAAATGACTVRPKVGIGSDVGPFPTDTLRRAPVERMIDCRACRIEVTNRTAVDLEIWDGLQNGTLIGFVTAGSTREFAVTRLPTRVTGRYNRNGVDSIIGCESEGSRTAESRRYFCRS